MEQPGVELFSAVFGSRETAALYAHIPDNLSNTRLVWLWLGQGTYHGHHAVVQLRLVHWPGPVGGHAVLRTARLQSAGHLSSLIYTRDG
jgi:hypothetical protein